MSTPGSLPDAYARYGALIAAQLEAVERGDLAALEPLAGARDAMAREIEALRAASPAVDADQGQVVVVLRRCLEDDLRLRRRLEALHAEVSGQIRRNGQSDAGLRVYAGAAVPGGTVDVSL